jgi:hypothetical protein
MWVCDAIIYAALFDELVRLGLSPQWVCRPGLGSGVIRIGGTFSWFYLEDGFRLVVEVECGGGSVICRRRFDLADPGSLGAALGFCGVGDV